MPACSIQRRYCHHWCFNRRLELQEPGPPDEPAGAVTPPDGSVTPPGIGRSDNLAGQVMPPDEPAGLSLVPCPYRLAPSSYGDPRPHQSTRSASIHIQQATLFSNVRCSFSTNRRGCSFGLKDSCTPRNVAHNLSATSPPRMHYISASWHQCLAIHPQEGWLAGRTIPYHQPQCPTDCQDTATYLATLIYCNGTATGASRRMRGHQNGYRASKGEKCLKRHRHRLPRHFLIPEMHR